MKKNIGKAILFFCLCNAAISIARVRVLYTAALTNRSFNVRKNQYISALKTLIGFGYNPYIVEAIRAYPTFFDSFSDRVFYSRVNNPHLSNKGINEANSMREALKYFDFEDDDIIIKVTGRYTFISDAFFRLVESDPSVDIWAKHNDVDWDVFTGCIAIRCKYLKKFLSQVNLAPTEALEWAIGRYIKKLKHQGVKVQYVEALHQKVPGWPRPV